MVGRPISRQKLPAPDQQMWDRLLSAGSLLDDHGEFAHLRPTTITTLKQAYGHWIDWLRKADPAALDIEPDKRASMERLRRWYDTMDHLRPMSRLIYIGGMLKVLRAVNPAGDWTPHDRLLKFLKAQAGSGDRRRKAGRILDSRVLFDIGIQYAQSSPKQSPTPLETASRFQMGTMIALLTLMPLRSSTFRRLELGKSVHVTDDGIEITIPGEMMKSGVAWDARVPDVIMPMLRHYLEEVRPWLLGRKAKKHDYLWVTRAGDPFTTGYIGERIARAVMEITGVRVPPHFFRDAAATTVVRHSVESAGLVRPLLAHSSSETADRHYIHAGSIEAGRDYAQLIRNRRKLS
jgi:integrase